MTQEEITKQIGEFESIRPRYVSLSRAFKALLRQLLEAEKIDYVTVEARAKEIESFEEKINREDKDYSNPVEEITDLAGIRIITYQTRDIEAVGKVITKNFEVDKNNSIDKRQCIEIDKFGYISVHYVVSLKSDRTKLPEYAEFEGLKAEIQVRTVLQHAWAAIDHKLRYKSKNEVPATLRRRLYRISALLETADDQFDTLTKQIKKVQDGYSNSVSKGSLNIPLNLDSISAYVCGNEHSQNILDLAEKSGMAMAPHSPNSKSPEFSNLLFFLYKAGVQTIAEFDKSISGESPDSEKLLTAIVDHWKTKVGGSCFRLMFTKDSILRIVYLLKQTPERAQELARHFRVGNTLRESIEEVYREIHNAPEFSIPNPNQNIEPTVKTPID